MTTRALIYMHFPKPRRPFAFVATYNEEKIVRAAQFNLMGCILMSLARATCQYDDGI